MNKIYAILITILLEAALIGSISVPAAAQTSVSFQVFYDQLSPYGRWVSYQNYGYVWVPTSVNTGFRPYADSGHWVYSPDGWTWVSDYDWGWAPFHYGNWFYDDSYGWMWAPGYDWAPAWVTWGEYQDNYCWAPIAPNINIGVSYSSYRPPSYCWTFAPRAHITSLNINRYYVNRSRNTTVINNITVINNVNSGNGGRFMRGPQPKSVERYTHTTVRPVQIKAVSAPGRSRVQNGQLALYRPAVNRDAGPARPAPKQVQDVRNLQPNKLPAYNRNVQPKNAPANNVATSNRPVNNLPNNARPATGTASRIPRPTATTPNANPNRPANPNIHKNNPVRNPQPASQPHNNPPDNSVRPPASPKPVQQRQHTNPVQPNNSPPNHTVRPASNPNPVQRQQHTNPVQQQRANPAQQRPVQQPRPQQPVQPRNPPPQEQPKEPVRR